MFLLWHVWFNGVPHSIYYGVRQFDSGCWPNIFALTMAPSGQSYPLHLLQKDPLPSKAMTLQIRVNNGTEPLSVESPMILPREPEMDFVFESVLDFDEPAVEIMDTPPSIPCPRKRPAEQSGKRLYREIAKKQVTEINMDFAHMRTKMEADERHANRVLAVFEIWTSELPCEVREQAHQLLKLLKK